MKSRIGKRITRIFRPSETETTYLHKGEIVVVFLISYFIALSLWLLVNMNKEYSFTLTFPLQVTEYSEEMAFVSDPPTEVRVGVSGEGWNLLSLYRTPPEISIPYSEEDVRINEIVQREIASYTDIHVQSVEPSRIRIRMEPKRTVRVPVQPELDIQLKPQFEIVGRIRVAPDSVSVTGARSVVDTLAGIRTETLRLRNVQSPVEQKLALKLPPGLSLYEPKEVALFVQVTEFTESEVRIDLRVRGVPDDREVRINPSVVTIRYHVPIDLFRAAQESPPYEAYVAYADVVRDTTGYVVPRVGMVAEGLTLRLQGIYPRRVSYFEVVPD